MFVTAVAALAEAKKRSKYSTLYKFMPVTIETLGAFGTHTLQFIKELGRRIKLQSGDPLAKCHLVQRLSVAIQQGNAASILSVTYFVLVTIRIIPYLFVCFLIIYLLLAYIYRYFCCLV